MGHFWKWVTKDRYSIQAEGKYRLKYDVGSIVEAPPNTLGIIFFLRKNLAKEFYKDFQFYNLCNKIEWLLIEIKLLENGKLYEYISRYTDEAHLDLFYKADPSKYHLSSEIIFCEPNTYFCNKIKVLT